MGDIIKSQHVALDGLHKRGIGYAYAVHFFHRAVAPLEERTPDDPLDCVPTARF